jgi:hypothetical protein
MFRGKSDGGESGKRQASKDPHASTKSIIISGSVSACIQGVISTKLRTPEPSRNHHGQGSFDDDNGLFAAVSILCRHCHEQ